MSGCNISGDANFWSAHFSGDVVFGSAHIRGNAVFRSAHFGGDANFRYARFSRNAYFVSAHISGNARFWSARFSGDAVFESAQFSGDTNFKAAQFSGNANFRDAQFAAGGVASFTTIKTLSSMDFSESAFRCPVFFTGARLGGLLSLRRSLINAPISMLAAGFDESSGEFNLVEAVFSAEIDVSWKQIEAPLREHLEQFLQEEPSQEEYTKETRLSLAQAVLVQLSRNFAKLGRTRDARLAGYTWIQLARRHSERKIWRRLMDWLLDIPSSRGTRPWKPLVFGLAIILLAAGIFALGESMSWPFGTAAFEATRSPTAKAPRYYSFLFSVENFMPAMKPKLIGSWEVSQKYIWVAQLEAMLGWLWFGLTAWSIRESFF